MTDEALMQATLMALTRQNVTRQVSPLSSYTVRARCIRANIRYGETVCITRNEDAAINRLGDMMTVGGVWWADEENRIYDRIGNTLRVRDGLSGEVLSSADPCYDIKICDGVLGVCVRERTADDNYEIWQFILPDGSKTAEIKMPFQARVVGPIFTNTYKPVVGYRNGILGIAHSQDFSPVWTYTTDGRLVFETAAVSGRTTYPQITHVFPITAYKVGVYVLYYTGLWTQVTTHGYRILTSEEENLGFLFANYYSASASTGQGCTYLGTDRSYFYAVNQLHDPDDTSVLLDEYVVARFSIDNYAGAEEVERYFTPRTFYGPAQSGLLGYSMPDPGGSGNYWYRFVERETMDTAFDGALNFESSTRTNLTMSDNAGYLWINNLGIYQKSGMGWVMWQSSVYGDVEPLPLLGYAAQNVTLGSEGTAFVLFTPS